MRCKYYASHYQPTFELDQGFNSRPSFGGSMVVGCPFTIDAISALVEFLGNRFNSEVEITSGLICYCLSVFPQLYRQCVKKMFSGPSASHTYSHRGVLPPHNFYKRHFDSLHGGRNLKPFQGGHSSLSKTYRIDFDESGVAETMETEFPGQHRSQTSSLKWHGNPSLRAVLMWRKKSRNKWYISWTRFLLKGSWARRSEQIRGVIFTRWDYTRSLLVRFFEIHGFSSRINIKLLIKCGNGIEKRWREKNELIIMDQVTSRALFLCIDNLPNQNDGSSVVFWFVYSWQLVAIMCASTFSLCLYRILLSELPITWRIGVLFSPQDRNFQEPSGSFLLLHTTSR